jgi:hypothetical protein
MMKLAIAVFLSVQILATHAILAQETRPSQRMLREYDALGLPVMAQSSTGNGPGTAGTVAAGRLDFDGPTPFVAFSAGWDEERPLTDNSRLWLSVSPDSLQWSAWKPLQTDAHATGAKRHHVTELAFLPADTRFFRINAATDMRGQGSRMTKLLVNFFSPGERPSSTVPQSSPSVTNTGCPCEKPAVVTRAGWNCPQTGNPGYSYTTVTHLIVHHSAGSNTSSDWAAVVLSIWNSHVNTNGWADIGYNYLIDPKGVVYEGRGGGDNVVGAHFCGTNGGTMGTCLIGTYTNEAITDTARSRLVSLLAWKACASSIQVTGSSLHPSSGRTLQHISGHRDGCATECPGGNFYATLPALRTAVSSRMAVCNAVTGVPVIDGMSNFRIAPNPAPSEGASVQLTLATPKSFSYEVFNAQGQRLHASTPVTVVGYRRIPLKGFGRANSGTVYIRFEVGGRSFTQQVRLEK